MSDEETGEGTPVGDGDVDDVEQESLEAEDAEAAEIEALLLRLGPSLDPFPTTSSRFAMLEKLRVMLEQGEITQAQHDALAERIERGF